MTVGASVGVAPLLPDTDGLTAWLQRADAACYEAKAAGRGMVRMAHAAPLRVVACKEVAA